MNIETLLPPFIVSGIIGTTLSLTIYSTFHILKDSHPRIRPSSLILIAASFFIISFLFTMAYIIFNVEVLLKLISLSFLILGGVSILILILQLVKLNPTNYIIDEIIDSDAFPQLFGEKQKEKDVAEKQD
jgi:hypothetical protein